MNLQRSRPQSLQQAPPESMAVAASAAPQASMLPLGAEQPFFRFDILRALQLHRKLALGFAIAGLVLAIAYAAITWPVYVAQSELYIQPTSAKVLDQSSNPQRWPYDSNTYDSFIQQQVQIASNPDVLVNALHKLPAGAWQKAGESDQAAAERLGRSLKVDRLGASYQVGITAQAKDPQLAADIANAVANSIVEKAAHEENAGDAQRLVILEGERDRVQKQLNADLTEQDVLNKQLGMAAVGAETPDLIDNEIGATRAELIKAQTDHDEAEARFAALDANQGTSSAALDAEADELVASDPGLTSMKTSLNQRRATLITQMANLTPNNPEYKLDNEELSQINSSLDSMMTELRAKAAARIQERLRTDLVRTSGVEAQLNGQLNQLAAQAAGATPKLQRANDLATDIIRQRNRYAAVDEEVHNIMLQDSVPGAVHLSVAAVPPLHPTISGILRKSLPLALGGLLLGLMAALLANNLDQKIYIGSDVEHLLGFAPMAALPDFGEVSEEVFEEHLLRLSTAFEHARKQGSLRNCIFTGTGPRTGVTTVVTRVRGMLASMGRPTVLVDATGSPLSNTRKGGQGSQSYGAREDSGADRGTRSLALLQRVTEESGAQDESLVLTDTAPLLISAETEYLARFVDCAVVVVESGVTTRGELRATADALQRLHMGAVGLVLNRVGMAKADAAFRKSVNAVTEHVRSQGRSGSRAAARSRHFAEEPVMHAEEPAAREQEHPMRVAEPPRFADELPMHAAAPNRIAEEEYRRILEQPATQEPEIPAPAVAQSAEPVAPQWAAAPVAPRPLQPPAWKAPAVQIPAEPEPEVRLPWWLSETPVSSPAIGALAAPAYEEPISPQEDDISYRPVSRLSGLRNVLFSAGIRGLDKNPETYIEERVQPAIEPEAPPYQEVQPYQAPASYFQNPAVPIVESFPEAPVAADGYTEVDAGNRVMATPEFLPPTTIVAPNDIGEVWDMESSGVQNRRDRRDALDDIDVLPSWRGQYRRKG